MLYLKFNYVGENDFGNVFLSMVLCILTHPSDVQDWIHWWEVFEVHVALLYIVVFIYYTDSI